MRKSIFDVLKDKRDYLAEIKRIEDLLDSSRGLEYRKKHGTGYTSNPDYYAIRSTVNNCVFKSWKQRGTCLDCDDMRDKLGLTDLIENEDENIDDSEFLLYLEFASNILYLIQYIPTEDDEVRVETEIESMTKENINICLGWFNLEISVLEEEDKVIVVEKNAATTAVAEILDADLSTKVVQYNHFLLKGDLDTKKSILISLYHELEPKRKVIKDYNSKLEENLFYLYNNLDIRHNNVNNGHGNYKEFVANMDAETLEEWYDELYQMMLLAFLAIDDIENRRQKVNQLKRNIDG